MYGIDEPSTYCSSQNTSQMAPNFNGKPPVIAPGSWILVTGANGYIASHVADQLLEAGYKVRGTVRDIKKNSWLPELFDQKYGPGKFEMVVVEDMTVPDAFDEATKGIPIPPTHNSHPRNKPTNSFN